MSDEYCSLENDFFPSEEFRDDPEWGRVHDVSSPHTVAGYLIEADATILHEADAEPEDEEW